MAKTPVLPDLETLRTAGINPATGLPIKMGGGAGVGFKADNRRLLRIIDEQDAVRRYTWHNLPKGLNGELIERILYYKGQGALFYMETDDTFYFLPYALDGGIDVYGRFNCITPLPFGGATSTKDSKGKEKPWIVGLQRIPRYDIKVDELKWSDITDSCVLLHDYTPQLSQTIIPRRDLNDPLLDVMADCIPFMHTSLQNATGVRGMRVENESDASNVMAANAAISNAALVGQWAVPIVGVMEFQDLTPGTLGKSEEFMLALQSLDSYRLSTYGLPSGGLFQKKAHMLEAEQNMNNGTASLVLQDGLLLRQQFCDIVNSYFGTVVSVDINESITGLDVDADGDAYGKTNYEAAALNVTSTEGGMTEDDSL